MDPMVAGWPAFTHGRPCGPGVYTHLVTAGPGPTSQTDRQFPTWPWRLRISTVDTLVAQARRLLAPTGINLNSPFTREVETGFRWGTAVVPASGRPAGLEVAVGVPASGRWSAADLADAITEGLEDFGALEPDEDIEISGFRFELY